MLKTTTSVVEGRPVQDYLGVVVGEAILGANIFKDSVRCDSRCGGWSFRCL